MRLLALKTNLLFIVCALFFYISPAECNIFHSLETSTLFFNSFLIVSILISIACFYFNRRELFSQAEYFRNFTPILASITACVYAYNHKMSLGLSILLLSLCLFYGIYKKTFYKPHPIMIALFGFCLVKLGSVFWASDMQRAFRHIDFYCMFIFLPIVSCFYRVKREELHRFIYISFVFSLFLLTLTFVSYVFLVKHLNVHFWSFLTFDKNYLSFADGYPGYYKAIFWTETLHPSKIAWLFLLLYAMIFWLWREEKKYLSSAEINLYFLLSFSVSFILQARIAIIGILVLALFFSWVEGMKWIKKVKIIGLLSALATCIGIGIVAFIIKKSSFFSDKIRHDMNTEALHSWKKFPLFGGGAGYETQVIRQAGYPFHSLHNEFLSALTDQGLFGVICLLLFHFLVVYYGLKNNYLLGIYVLLAFTTFNLTEGVLGLGICVPFFLYSLLPFEKNRI